MKMSKTVTLSWLIVLLSLYFLVGWIDSFTVGWCSVGSFEGCR